MKSGNVAYASWMIDASMSLPHHEHYTSKGYSPANKELLDKSWEKTTLSHSQPYVKVNGPKLNGPGLRMERCYMFSVLLA